MANNLIKLILDSFRKLKESNEDSTDKNFLLGKRLLEFAQGKTDNKKTNIIDPETDAKIRFLKKCEEENNLCYIEPACWNVCTKSFQQLFIEKVEPLIMGAVYFPFSKYYAIQDKLISLLTPHHSLFCLRLSTAFQIYVIGENSYHYGYMSQTELKKLNEKFHDQIVYSVGLTTGHEVQSKVFKQMEFPNGEE